MTILAVFVAVAVIGLAAGRWGADSREDRALDEAKLEVWSGVRFGRGNHIW